MEKISVIVPVYNVEKFLKRCLDSLINQTYENLEIICINDGSTDNSLKILKEYAQKDSRIIIIDQENKKLGAARNRGLNASTGKYISFVDSDDWVDLNYFEKLYNAITKYNCDCSMSEIIKDKANGRKYYFLKNRKDSVKYNLKYSINEMTVKGKWYIVWGKLYRRECIGDLRFIENAFYEDGEYLIILSTKISSVAKIKGSAYHYFENTASIIRGPKTIAKIEEQIDASIRVNKFALENNIKIKKSPLEKIKGKFLTKKIFVDEIGYYFLGIKVFSIKKDYPLNKKFLIIAKENLNQCELIKKNLINFYPNSEILILDDLSKLSEINKNEYNSVFIVDEIINESDIKRIIKTKYIFKSNNPCDKLENLSLLQNLTHRKLIVE